MNLVCSECGAVNRVPESKLQDKPVCGKCKQSLVPTSPVDLNQETFGKFITRTELPVLVDFWAPWCGPCRMMAPAFAQAAAQLSPRFVLAKLDTEAAPQVASQFAISSIPTMILFRAGKEISRQSGAMNAAQITRFAAQE